MNMPKLPLNLTDTSSILSEELNPNAIFKRSSYANILNDESKSQYFVSITPWDEAITIKGLLTSEFKYSIDAQWEALDLISTITSNFHLLNTLYKMGKTVLNAGGYADPSNLGVSSEKIYKNSGYLQIDIGIRIVDWYGKGEPLNYANVLSNMCLPKDITSMTLKQFDLDLTEAGTDTIRKILQMLVFGKYIKQEHVESLVADIEKLGGHVLDTAVDGAEGIFTKILERADTGKKAWEAFKKQISDQRFLVIASSPLSVRIDIGNFFTHTDMILESVTPSFSKVCSEAGPLWVDIDIKASSRRALVAGSIDGIGLRVGHKAKSRSYSLKSNLKSAQNLNPDNALPNYLR